ncbi:class E sortase [Kitasatospora cathayae]|uniref:Class E sortase n=1 Tax=Kitasatospora cathayae TaxID=3004092 RepID=A0ABY7QA96_9ACTN|nr:class E sortase [Kitasatospora sp. HUAS 3-15]WBP89124.1 class E sortase [Kitasatospora sp. HUAS 3-15]
MARRRVVVVRAVARGVGDVLLTFGLLVVLFAVYVLWWSNVVSDRAADRAAGRLRDSWSTAAPAAPPAAESPAPVPGLGRGDLGFLHVPAMGRDFQVLIRPGTDEDTLAEGVAGVYTVPYRSVPPWEGEGNFALAAHRDGHGAKFHDLDRVGPGDAVVVETRERWYVYRVDGVLPETSPDDVGAIAPVPVGSPYRSPGRYITLTTCTPAYTSLYRLVVWGSLVREEAMAPGRVPPVELR